jgi:hypothetical protein
VFIKNIRNLQMLFAAVARLDDGLSFETPLILICLVGTEDQGYLNRRVNFVLDKLEKNTASR